jgi:hypothetical protein
MPSRLAPLPPSKFLLPRTVSSPSDTPPPNRNTNWVILPPKLVLLCSPCQNGPALAKAIKGENRFKRIVAYYPSIRVKSATRCTASRNLASNPSLNARLAGSGSFTITPSKKASIGARKGERRHGVFKIFGLNRGSSLGLGAVEGGERAMLLGTAPIMLNVVRRPWDQHRSACFNIFAARL